MASRIEWTDETWNPVRGCTKISPGCKNCYAEKFAERWRGVEGHPYEQGFDLRLVPERLHDPLYWRKPQRIFVNSMSDLFNEEIPGEYIDRVFRVMYEASWHTYQILTKRAERMSNWADSRVPCDEHGDACVGDDVPKLDHIWLGVSVEDRRYGVPRIDILREVPRPFKRFLSIEPLLEDLGTIDLCDIDWVIIGGESGPGARSMRAKWALKIIDRCRMNDVPVFFKQAGIQLARSWGCKDRKGGNPAEWPESFRVRQMPCGGA